MMKRVPIKARPDHPNRRKRFTQDITVVLGDDIEADYEVVEKDFPEDLPESWTDPDDGEEKQISWFGNFGLKKPDGQFEDKLPPGKKYQVELPAGFRKFVYYDGSQVLQLTGRVRSGKFFADLDLGDPPMGGSETR
jgi:hypothetical protein